jgi:histidinol-phosphate/aromatic aminotransferase/cobyric acid decarboxylase-like protein
MNTPSSLAAIVRPELAELAAYSTPQCTYAVPLDANEAPEILSPEARAALANVLVPPVWCRYPEQDADALREAIAAYVGASAEEVLVTSGSVEAIELLLGALSRPREGMPAATMVTTTPTFVMYKHCARTQGMNVVEVPLDAAWDLDVEGLQRAIELARPNLVFIATPNTPTGNAMSEKRLRAVIEVAPDALVVLDQAYGAFARRSAGRLRHEYGNVSMLGTLSKLGFASIRVGWIVGPAEIVREVKQGQATLQYFGAGPARRDIRAARARLRNRAPRGIRRQRAQAARGCARGHGVRRPTQRRELPLGGYEETRQGPLRGARRRRCARAQLPRVRRPARAAPAHHCEPLARE